MALRYLGTWAEVATGLGTENPDRNDTDTADRMTSLTAFRVGTETISRYPSYGTDAYAYAYDNIGNRLTAQEAEEQTAYTANNLNQYTAIQEGEAEAFAPTYDADGNQTLVKTSTGIWTVTYTAANRPTVFANEATGTVVECSYDSAGRRATKKVTVNGTVTLHQCYIYRGYLQIACCDLTRTAHPCLWLITWDPTQPIATRPLAIQKDGTWYTYGFDLTKNVTEVFTTTGYIGTAYTYTPYGEVSASGNVTQPIQWSSEYLDTELGLVYYNYRHYNPADGRWLRRDPAFWNFNVYWMMSPTVNVDLLGLRTVSKKKKCCPESIEVQFGRERIYSETLKEFDRENIRGWLSQPTHAPINDRALTQETRNLYGEIPYGIVRPDMSDAELEKLFEGHDDLWASRGRVIKKKPSYKNPKLTYGYHGYMLKGILTGKYSSSSHCQTFSFPVQAGGRAYALKNRDLKTTAPIDGEGYVYIREEYGSIAGFKIAKVRDLHGKSDASKTTEKAKPGVWGKDRSEIMIHLAPATGYKNQRQLGSHGCISTQDETAWSRFSDAVENCGKISLTIKGNSK